MSVNPIDNTGIAAREYEEIAARMRGKGGGCAQAAVNYVILGGSASITLAIWGDSHSFSDPRAILGLIAFPLLVAGGYFLQLVMLRSIDEPRVGTNALEAADCQVLSAVLKELIAFQIASLPDRASDDAPIRQSALTLAATTMSCSLVEKGIDRYRDTQARSPDSKLAKNAERLNVAVRERNREFARMDDSLLGGHGRRLLSLDDSIAALGGGPEYWDEFFKREPDSLGIVFLSTPGFDQSARLALVYSYAYRGPRRRPLHGFSFLARTDEVWVVRKCQVFEQAESAS